MAKFSDRIGITQTASQLQISEMSKELHNALWNVVAQELHNHIMSWYQVMEILNIRYFNVPIDELPGERDCRVLLYNIFCQLNWFQVYNLIEFIIQNIGPLTDNRRKPEQTEEAINEILKREMSGYRSINLKIVPISNDSEVQSIKNAMNSTSALGIYGINEHFNTALTLLAKKPEPDFRNSIKESISALEGLCKIVTGEKSGGIEKALAKLSASTSLHPSLKSAFSSLYGYASDEDGIRHPLLDNSVVGFAEAEFMLVTCSAAVNFIIEKARQAKLI